jgi:hypothetical protein
MPKPTSAASRNLSGYQKYFDPKSLKSVASSAGIIFIITHLIDYLSNYSIPLRFLNFIILALCLIITFLFVVNEFGKLEEKIILGIANAALLFFSVIGFNATMTSNALFKANAERPIVQIKLSDPKIGSRQMPMPTAQQASLFTFLKIRAWMPSLQLQNQVEKLTLENQILQKINKSATDSLIHDKFSGSNNNAFNNEEELKKYASCKMTLDSLKAENIRLFEQIQDIHRKAVAASTSTATAITPQDTSFMSKTNYIASYRVMKQQFEKDLRQCQLEANEYRSKYIILLGQAHDLMDRVQPDNH